MKKSILPLVIVAVVLVALVFMKNNSEKQINIGDQVALVPLAQEGLTASDLEQVELHLGSDRENKVVLARDKANRARWRVASHFDAPVKQETIDSFAKDLAGLQGEFRTEAASDSDLETYELTDEKALHITAFGTESNKALFHVLVGKSPDFKSVFMRRSGNMTVYVEDSNLRSTAGVSTAGSSPQAAMWLDKEVLRLTKEDVQRIELDAPGKRLVFNGQDKALPDPPAIDPAAPALPAVAEKEWTIAEGGPGKPHKQTGVDGLLTRLATLDASTVVDPSKAAEYGLEPPMYQCTVTLSTQEEPVVIAGGRMDPSGSGYIRVTSAEGNTIYEVAKYHFEAIFPKGGDLFDLDGLEIASDPDRIELTQAGSTIILAKEGESWTVAEPAIDLPVQDTVLTGIANALKGWRPADYNDSPDDTGLADSTRSVTVSAGGTKHTVVFGADSTSVDGIHAMVEGSELALAMTRSDIDKIFRAPKDLFQRALFNFASEDVTAITVARASDNFALNQAGGAWSLLIDGEPAPRALKTSVAEDVAAALADLQASDILFEQDSLTDGDVDTVTVHTTDGADHTLQIGPRTGAAHAATVSGKKTVFSVDVSDLTSVLAPTDSLMEPAATLADPVAGSDSPPEPTALNVQAPEPPAIGLPPTPAVDVPAQADAVQ
jgi:hypothetical protein